MFKDKKTHDFPEMKGKTESDDCNNTMYSTKISCRRLNTGMLPSEVTELKKKTLPEIQK